MKKLIFMGCLGLFFLGSCNNQRHTHAEHEGHEHADHEGHDHEGHDHEGDDHEGHDHEAEAPEKHADEISFCKEKAKTVGLKSDVIKPRAFQQVIKTSGQLTAAQGDEATVVATVAGVVSFRSQLTEGLSVKRGQTVLTLSAEHLTDGDPVQRARATYQIALKEYNRMKQLIQTKIVSEKEFAQAEQNFQNARISYEGLAKNQSAHGQQISAPIAGFVKSLLVKEGDYVSVGQPLMSITQNRRLFLRAEVSEKHYAALHQIHSANFKTPYNKKVYELQTLNGKLLSFGKAASDNSFYIPVTFEFDNKGEFIPGAFVEVYLLSTTLENVLVLPRTALTEEQGHLFVYLQMDEEGYKKQEVTLGADNGKEVQILSGIQPGDRVVTEGAYQLRLASASHAIPAHSHQH
ncbi:MAG: efflux RND transporter periplasmic adaptor subunit [Bacteroidia bacterium]|nr:efflux RND transporter periplasmic adaptor subunit [Bacteroidia bacterium]